MTLDLHFINEESTYSLHLDDNHDIRAHKDGHTVTHHGNDICGLERKMWMIAYLRTHSMLLLPLIVETLIEHHLDFNEMKRELIQL